jgi:hypothetical protein
MVAEDSQQVHFPMRHVQHAGHELSKDLAFTGGKRRQRSCTGLNYITILMIKDVSSTHTDTVVSVDGWEHQRLMAS